MSARDELALDIFLADNGNIPEGELRQDWADAPDHHRPYAQNIADGLIATGYSKPRTITTVEELGALPVGKKVVSGGYEWTKHYSTTYTPDHAVEREQWFNLYEDAYDSNELSLPATVIHESAVVATR